ncbi:phage protein [Streptococcus pneumoniae]|nr:phage protein [Streptococcus pneumoniae]
MNKQELIRKYENACFGTVLVDEVLENLKQLDEPEKVKVKQFVAEIIEYYKGQNATLYDALREKNFNKQYNEWLMNEQDAYNKVARAWLDGYEVEKEKRYLVKVKGISGYSRYLNKDLSSEKYFFASKNEINGYRTKHTRKQLEEAGFGWVFSCEGIEIEEVEG